jgi:hypothetical protein
VFSRWEQKARELQGPKQMKTFSETQKGKKLKGGGKGGATDSI